jgi:PAS domain S-box-containing protein
MAFIVAGLLGALAILVAVIARLLVERRALRESEDRFRRTADQAPVLIWTARPDSTLDYLNDFCEQLTGRPLEQLRERGWLDYVHPDDVDRCLATYMPAFEARRPFLLEYRLRHAHGDYRWFLATGVPNYGRDGRYTGYIGCDIDITERKKAEDHIQFLAGRLIGAQEVERARIARDLHDDVSQQLAGVSIAFSGLKQRLNDYRVGEELQHELGELQQQTRTLARNDAKLEITQRYLNITDVGVVRSMREYWGRQRTTGRAHG